MHGEGTTTDGAYQVGFGWRRADLYLIPLVVLFAAGSGWLALAADRDGSGRLRNLPESAREAVGVGLAAFFCLVLLGILVVRLSGQLSGRVALRVDAAGVTLGMAPPWPRRYVAMVPWSEITAVFLWQAAGYNRRYRMHYLGLKRRKGARQLPGSSRGRSLSMLQRSAPRGVPAQVVAESRMLERGRVDRDQLAEAVARFAPQVTLVDHW